jgi:hypothetical protein
MCFALVVRCAGGRSDLLASILPSHTIETPVCLVLYHFGSYRCAGGKWKGEVVSQEHMRTINVRPFAGYIASMGFAGTYTDDGAEFEATALVGKRSIRLKTVFRLLIAD